MEEDAEPSGPNGTGRLFPLPQTPTDAPEQPPDADPLLPPPEEEEDVDNGTTFVPDTPTTDLYGEEVTMETEATTEPDMEFPSDLTPHGECVSVLIYWADATPPSTLRRSHSSSSPVLSNSVQAMQRCVLSCWHESQQTQMSGAPLAATSAERQSYLILTGGKTSHRLLCPGLDGLNGWKWENPWWAAMGSGSVMALLGCDVYCCHGWWVAHKADDITWTTFTLECGACARTPEVNDRMRKGFGKCGEAVCTDMVFN